MKASISIYQKEWTELEQVFLWTSLPCLMGGIGILFLFVNHVWFHLSVDNILIMLTVISAGILLSIIANEISRAPVLEVSEQGVLFPYFFPKLTIESGQLKGISIQRSQAIFFYAKKRGYHIPIDPKWIVIRIALHARFRTILPSPAFMTGPVTHKVDDAIVVELEDTQCNLDEPSAIIQEMLNILRIPDFCEINTE